MHLNMREFFERTSVTGLAALVILSLTTCDAPTHTVGSPSAPVVPPKIDTAKPSDDSLVGNPADFSGLWSGPCLVKRFGKTSTDCKYDLDIRQNTQAIFVKGTILLDGRRNRMDWLDGINGNSLGTDGTGRGRIGQGAILYELPTFTLAMRFVSPTQITYVYDLKRNDQPHFSMTATLLKR